MINKHMTQHCPVLYLVGSGRSVVIALAHCEFKAQNNQAACPGPLTLGLLSCKSLWIKASAKC